MTEDAITPPTEPTRRSSDGGQLLASAKSWLADAMTAWADDDFRKVAALAPLAVEHLGKAVLWETNPALLVPLEERGEASLFILASKPSLASPQLRTVGLSTVLGRVERVLGGLPVEWARRKRLVDARNGAMHVGSATTSRHVLLDSLALCQAMLVHLGEPEDAFFGDHHASVEGLLGEKRSEVGHRVAALRARARRTLTDLEGKLGTPLFAETVVALESRAPFDLPTSEFARGLVSTDEKCPECGRKGRLFGELSVDSEIDYDVEPLGGGQYESFPVGYYYVLGLTPEVFACNVCRLRLSGTDELQECGLPTTRLDVEETDLGPNFELSDYYTEEDDYDAYRDR